MTWGELCGLPGHDASDRDEDRLTKDCGTALVVLRQTPQKHDPGGGSLKHFVISAAMTRFDHGREPGLAPAGFATIGPAF